ncbi:uncharacterized protein Dvar_45140 [Desulfosarcina variabilis str. Montpellier]
MDGWSDTIGDTVASVLNCKTDRWSSWLPVSMLAGEPGSMRCPARPGWDMGMLHSTCGVYLPLSPSFID